MGILLYEHKKVYIKSLISEEGTQIKQSESLTSIDAIESHSLNVPVFVDKRRNKNNCISIFNEDGNVCIEAGYYIGVDWLVKGRRSIHVTSKANAGFINHFNEQLKREENETLDDSTQYAFSDPGHFEINYLKILLDIMGHPQLSSQVSGLVQINWSELEIELHQKKDQLTPFLVVQFLNLLHDIVRKGLKRSYYKVQENLNNRVKGKVLVGKQIKLNIPKRRFNKTYCEYQEFGDDNIENRFLKKVMRYVVHYVDNHKIVFGNNLDRIQWLINYIRPAFEKVGDEIKEVELRHFKTNPFFKEYKEAVSIGQSILKRFSYNISKTGEVQVSTPPFWIDMPLLFEMYVYQKILMNNIEDQRYINHQFATYGNSLDFLITKPGSEMVIDAKYKLHYKNGHIHNDIRQVAGYARLKKVRKALGLSECSEKEIDCLIIYPDIIEGLDLENDGQSFSFENLIVKENEIAAYSKVFKLGVKLPLISSAGNMRQDIIHADNDNIKGV